MKYRGHTITKGAPDGLYATLGGAPGYDIEGPVLTGSTPRGVADAKRWIDECIKQKACGDKTKHANVVVKNTRKTCADCGQWLGYAQ